VIHTAVKKENLFRAMDILPEIMEIDYDPYGDRGAHMASLLRRYCQGECVQVWQELTQDANQYEGRDISEEALAVVQETMRRVASNIEQLIPKLVSLGYQFGYGWVQPPSHSNFTYYERRNYHEYREWVNEQADLYSPPHDWQRIIDEHKAAIESFQRLNSPSIFITTKLADLETLQRQRTAHQLVEALAERHGPLPLSLRMWYEMVGSVNFVGQMPEHWRRLVEQEAKHRPEDEARHSYWKYDARGLLDPLYVAPLTPQLVDELVQRPPQTTIGIPLAPAAPDKYDLINMLGDYYMTIPSAGIDALLINEPHHTTLVEYLRLSFQWGGFPGWSDCSLRPEEDLAFLTEGLLPI
jgi:hypothetical protein